MGQNNNMGTPITNDGKNQKKHKVRVVIDTCFWVSLARLDLVSSNFSPGQKKEREERALKAYLYMRKNRDRIEMVSDQFILTELERVAKRNIAKARELGYSEASLSCMLENYAFARKLITTGAMRYKLNLKKHIEDNPDLPLPPATAPSRTNPFEIVLRENPDRQLFAIADMLRDRPGGCEESIILTFDKNHVVGAGKWRGITPMGPEFLEEQVESILYAEQKREGASPEFGDARLAI